MPYKSRRERRNMPRNVNTVPAKASPEPAIKTAAAQPTKSAPSANLSSRGAPAPVTTYPYIGNEVKWIAVVTAITAVVLIIAYYIFR